MPASSYRMLASAFVICTRLQNWKVGSTLLKILFTDWVNQLGKLGALCTHYTTTVLGRYHTVPANPPKPARYQPGIIITVSQLPHNTGKVVQ